MKHYLGLFLFLCNYLCFSQKQYPKDYFSAPLNIPIVLAGTFGELRSNHFHAGVDIKTQGKEGIPIYAPADGYVFRIKVAQYGYGKTLYVKHPNGYTTVYAHLQKFSSKIQQYVKRIQYEKENFYTGNLFPKSYMFPITKGEVIGYTGNTGSSSGPHLHYEIRDSATENIINPMHFGLEAKDTKPPTIRNLMVYPLNNDSRINYTFQKTDLPLKKTENQNYITDQITANGYIGFGINVFDRLDNAMNKNGIYSLEMTLNGQRVYYHNLETFSFAESKHINLLIDYEHYAEFKNRLQRTYKVKGNKLSLYKDLIENGKVYIAEGFDYIIKIIAKDFSGNTSTVQIPVKGVAHNAMFSQKDTTAYKITATNFHKFNFNNGHIAFPKNTFYNDVYLDIKTEDSLVKIHTPTIPLDRKFTLTFFTSHLTEQEKQYVYIANVKSDKYHSYTTTKKKDSKVYTTTKTLGNYALKLDSIPPKITVLNLKNDQSADHLRYLNVKIKDSDSGIGEFRATINDKWILMEYNHKKGILTYDFLDKKLVGNKHIFKLVVSDKVGNTKELSRTFYRKP